MSFQPKIDPNHNHTPDDPRIFVFGSNLKGIHGGGAAWYAHKKLGAEIGIGEGLTGRTYALPTCYWPGEPVTYEELMVYVQNFLAFAERRHDLRFFVSAVGCGLAGFDESEVAPLFKDAPINCDLPVGWGHPTCKRIVGVPIKHGVDPEECGANATHLFRYDYVDTIPEPYGDPGRRHFGGTTLCQAHYDMSRRDNMMSGASPAWVKL